MKPTVLFLLFFSLPLCYLASGDDSLVHFSDLSIKNDAERTALKNIRDKGDKTDVIDIFLNHYTNPWNYSSSKAHEQISECVNDLKKATSGQDDIKKIKTIYKEVHKRFLGVYKLQNSFSDIFEKGEYNCVSGSALYAIVFHLMDIPYQIVEAPQHVFLFAYPNTHRIAIETTDPKDGYFKFSDSYIEKFTHYLYESKLIPKDEYENSTATQLFERYYFEKSGLSLLGLAAIQYANYTTYYLNDNENEKALDEIKKAYFIHQSERNKYLLHSTLWNSLSNSNYKRPQDVGNLVILCRANNGNNKETGNEKIKYEFSRLTQEQLVSNSDFSAYSTSYNSIYPSIEDTLLKKDIAFHYHYEMARLGFTNGKGEDYEMEHLKAAYAAKPRHADLRNMIKSYFSHLTDRNLEMKAFMKRMEEFTLTFDFLNEDGQFNSIRANGLLEMAWQGFIQSNAAIGEKHLKDFEQLCKKYKEIKPGERFVEKAYSSAATYYYKKGNSLKTREMLKTGLRYAPENFGLQARLKQAG